MVWTVPAAVDPSHISELFKKAHGDISRSGKIIQGNSGGGSSSLTNEKPPTIPMPTATTSALAASSRHQFQQGNPLSIDDAPVDLSTQDKLKCLSLLREVASSILEGIAPASSHSTVSSTSSPYIEEVSSIATKSINAGKRIRKNKLKLASVGADNDGVVVASSVTPVTSDSPISLMTSGVLSGFSLNSSSSTSTVNDAKEVTDGGESLKACCRNVLEATTSASHFKALSSFMTTAMAMETISASSSSDTGHCWWTVGDVLTKCSTEGGADGAGITTHDEDETNISPIGKARNLWKRILSSFVQGLFFLDLRVCAIRLLLVAAASNQVCIQQQTALAVTTMEILSSPVTAKLLGLVYGALKHSDLYVHISVPEAFLAQSPEAHSRLTQALSTGRASSAVLTTTSGITIRRRSPTPHSDLYGPILERHYWSHLESLSQSLSAHTLTSQQLRHDGRGPSDPLESLYKRLLGISTLHNDMVTAVLLGSGGGGLGTFREHVVAPLVEASSLIMRSVISESPILDLLLPLMHSSLETVLGCTALQARGGDGGHTDAALAAAQLIRQELVLPFMQNTATAIADHMRREALFGDGMGISSYLGESDDDDQNDSDKQESIIEVGDAVSKTLRRQLAEKRRILNAAVQSQLTNSAILNADATTPCPSTPWQKLFSGPPQTKALQLRRTVPAHRFASVLLLTRWYMPLQMALAHLKVDDENESPVARFHRTTVLTYLFHTLRLIEGIKVSEDDKIASQVVSETCPKEHLASMNPQQRSEEIISAIKRVFRQQQQQDSRLSQLVVTDETLISISKQLGITTKRLGPNTSVVLKSMQHLSGNVLQRHVGNELLHLAVPSVGGGDSKELQLQYWTVYASDGTLYARASSQLPQPASSTAPSSNAVPQPPAAAPVGKRRAPAGVGASGRVATGLSTRVAAVTSSSEPFLPVKSLEKFLAASGNAF